MALQNGIMTGQQAAKLDAYPVLSGESGQYLTGAGTWQGISEATTTTAGFMPASDKAFLNALLAGTLKNPTTNSETGALEYKYNGVVILSIPTASGQ